MCGGRSLRRRELLSAVLGGRLFRSSAPTLWVLPCPEVVTDPWRRPTGECPGESRRDRSGSVRGVSFVDPCCRLPFITSRPRPCGCARRELASLVARRR